MEWFWYFFIYSAGGCLLELAYAGATGGRRDRKRTLLLPLCPVYGAGMLAVLICAAPLRTRPVLAALLSAGAATGVEYAASLFYEAVLGVAFWDYRDYRWNLNGRVCAAFSAAWGLLALPVLYWLQPAVSLWAAEIPVPVTLTVMAATGADLLVSGYMLRRTGDRACLQWYRSRGYFTNF